MIVVPGLIIFKAKALRRPNRIRLSTLFYYQYRFSRRTVKHSHVGLPLMLLDASGLRVPEWVATTMQMDLTRSLLISSDCGETGV